MSGRKVKWFIVLQNAIINRCVEENGKEVCLRLFPLPHSLDLSIVNTTKITLQQCFVYQWIPICIVNFVLDFDVCAVNIGTQI